MVSATNPVTLTVDGNKAITGTFTLDSYTLITATAGTGSGSVSLDPAGGVYSYGTVVTVTATSSPGSTFTGWSGAVVSAANPVTLTMDGNKAITGTFTLDGYALTTSTTGTGSGSVGLDPAGGVYSYGTVVTVTAVADAGSTFTGWDGAVVSATNPVTLTMDGNKAITGTFTLDSYTLITATAGTGSGSVSLDPAGGVYSYGTVVTVTATANTGSTFTGWRRRRGECNQPGYVDDGRQQGHHRDFHTRQLYADHSYGRDRQRFAQPRPSRWRLLARHRGDGDGHREHRLDLHRLERGRGECNQPGHADDGRQ